MSKIFRIQRRFIIMSYKQILQYPFIIVGGFLEVTALILSFFIFWQVILVGRTFGGWSLHEILIFSSIGYLCWGIASFFFTGIWTIPFKIVEGEIERWLCRPVRHPLLGILFEDIWVGGSAFFTVSVFLLVSVSLYYQIQYHLINVLLALLILLLGMTALYLLYGTIACLAGFTIGRANFIENIFDSVEDSFVRIPVTTLPQGIKGILIFGFPVAFISAFPAEILLERITITNAIELLIIEVLLISIWLSAFLITWRIGLRRYESASN